MTLTRVKICCISSRWEAAVAVRAGASALGLVSAMPSGPGVIGDEEIADIARSAPPGVSRFLLTCRTDAEGIANQVWHAGVDTVQLVDRVEVSVHRRLRELLPNTRLVQVVHVLDEPSIDEAAKAAESVDAILLDSGNPNAVVKTLGGTGRRHDWSVSRRIRESIDKPLFLAGGLTPENVAEAIREVRPFGVDVCSGLRIDNRLDPERVERFMAAVRSGSAS